MNKRFLTYIIRGYYFPVSKHNSYPYFITANQDCVSFGSHHQMQSVCWNIVADYTEVTWFWKVVSHVYPIVFYSMTRTFQTVKFFFQATIEQLAMVKIVSLSKQPALNVHKATITFGQHH